MVSLVNNDLVQQSVYTKVAPKLTAILQQHRFTAAGIQAFLGIPVYEALQRGEPAAVLFHLQEHANKPLAVLLELFSLHEPVAPARIIEVFGADFTQELIDAGVLGHRSQLVSGDDSDVETLTALIDVTAHVIQHHNQWVFSDVDASQLDNYIPGAEHVLGVGAASLSLLKTTPKTFVNSVLDLGTGSGIQILGQLDCSRTITATDIHPRALDFAVATLRAASDRADTAEDEQSRGATVELLQGSWFEPVAGRSFDRIIANPPFVVGPGVIEHVYRDSGVALDGATALVVGQSIEHLRIGGTAHLLGAWVHQHGQSWQQRIASWLPDYGVRAWVLQRDVVSPQMYVGTWLRDESIDPRSRAGRAKTTQWLQHFRDADVAGVGFGFIALERLEDSVASDIVIETLEHSFDGDLGPEIEEYFLRSEWLSHQDTDHMLDARYFLRPSVAKEDIYVADKGNEQGFIAELIRLSRMDGPRWSHEIDEHLAAIIAGLHPHGLSLREIVSLYAYGHQYDEAELQAAIIAPFVDLIRHGLILPTELLRDGEY